MNYVGTLSEAYMSDILSIPASELVYLSDDDKITAKFCNKLIYQSAESYGILDKKHTKEQEEIVYKVYFKKVDVNVLRNNERRTKVLNELCRRLDKFITRIEKRYYSKEGQEILKNAIKTIKSNPKNYLIYLDKTLASDVKIFDSISCLNRTFKYFDTIYNQLGLQIPKLRPIMDKYIDHPIVNYFLRSTTGINLDSRQKIDENEYNKLKNNQQNQNVDM